MARFFVTVNPVQRPDPLTDPFPLDDKCRHPVVYIENRCCCQHQQKPPPRMDLKPFLLPSPNGSVPQTQLLPTVKAGKADDGEAEARHRKGEDDDGTDLKDILLGCLIGAAAAIFVTGLLLIFLIG